MDKKTQKFKMAPIFIMEIFLASFQGALIFVRNLKTVKFLCILKYQTKNKIKKIAVKKTKLKMAAKFKMAAKTKFAYVAIRTLVRLMTFDIFDYAFS
jgi:hypothetical protein